jgi:hypothetical protein
LGSQEVGEKIHNELFLTPPPLGYLIMEKNTHTKKEYTMLLKEVQKVIDNYLYKIRNTRNENERIFLEYCKEDSILEKKKIQNKLKFFNTPKDNGNLLKAKEYPIEQLIKFDRAGFASCPFHPDKTPSMKLYPKRNKAHCFSCSGDWDSIDIYMKLNNVNLSEAIKKLS